MTAVQPEADNAPHSLLAWLRKNWARLTAGTALGAVALVAGIISYTHIDAVTLALHGSAMVGHLMPFGVDGQIVVGSVVLLTTKGKAARWGWLGVVLGMAESLFANFESGIAHGVLSAGWDTVPAASFAVATFMFERWLKAQVTVLVTVTGTGRASEEPKNEEPAEVQANTCPHKVPSSVDEAIVQAYLHARDCTGEGLSQRQLSAMFGPSRPKVAELVKPYLRDVPETGRESAPGGPGEAAAEPLAAVGAVNGYRPAGETEQGR